MDSDCLALDGLEASPMSEVQVYSIIYRIAKGKQKERKVLLCKPFHL
jgi:hypothetical protein